MIIKSLLLFTYLGLSIVFADLASSKTTTESELIDELIIIDSLEKKLLDIEQIWKIVFEWKEDAKTTSVTSSGKDGYLIHFLNLPKKNQMQLFKENKKLKSTAEYWLPVYKKIQRQKDSLQNKISTQVTKKPALVEAVIKGYHGGRIEIPDSGLDYLFGMEFFQTEYRLFDKYYGLPDGIVGFPKKWSQSSYRIIRDLFTHFEFDKDVKFYDLGSGYGRLLYYGGVLKPSSRFTGIELVCERVDQVNGNLKRLGVDNSKAICGDVLQQSFDDGDVFFIFNAFPSIMDKVMEKLKRIAMKRKIYIVGLGPTYDDLKKIPWIKFERNLSEITNLGLFSAAL